MLQHTHSRPNSVAATQRRRRALGAYDKASGRTEDHVGLVEIVRTFLPRCVLKSERANSNKQLHIDYVAIVNDRPNAVVRWKVGDYTVRIFLAAAASEALGSRQVSSMLANSKPVFGDEAVAAELQAGARIALSQARHVPSSVAARQLRAVLHDMLRDFEGAISEPTSASFALAKLIGAACEFYAAQNGLHLDEPTRTPDIISRHDPTTGALLKKVLLSSAHDLRRDPARVRALVESLAGVEQFDRELGLTHGKEEY